LVQIMDLSGPCRPGRVTLLERKLSKKWATISVKTIQS
jgi:hypothetical protein